MDKGLTLASMLNDVPISRWDAGAGSDQRRATTADAVHLLTSGARVSRKTRRWHAHAGHGRRLRLQKYLQCFGFPAQNIALHTESLALGSASFTPMQVARGYAVMAKRWLPGGPVVISKIENDQAA
ncbi:hypothetical protein ACNKHU_20960 [Shigella flexneri]